MSKLMLVSLFALCATSLMALLTFFQGSAEELGYSLEFEATGFVENFAQQGNHCRTKVAIFEAAQLIGDFTTEDVPRRDDRYILQASGELCQAVNIATIIGGRHIAFYVAKSGQEWHFVEAPAAGTGCGGLQMQWSPGPVTVVRGKA